MKPASTSRFPDPCTSTPERVRAAEVCERLLTTCQLDDGSPLQFLKRSLELPCGENTYKALRKLSVKDFRRDSSVTVRSLMPRAGKYLEFGIVPAIQLPNVWRTLPKVCIERFLEASEQSLIEELAGVGNFQALGAITNGRLFECLEARLPGSGFPPLLVCITNFVLDAPQPAGVTRSGKQGPARRHIPTDAQTSERRSQVSKALSTGVAPETPIFAPDCEGITTSPFLALAKLECFYSNEYLTKPKQYRDSFLQAFPRKKGPKAGRKTKSSSVSGQRILSALPSALQIVEFGVWNGRMTGPLKEAIVVVWASGVVAPHPNLVNVLKQPGTPWPREMEVSCPFRLFELYGLTMPYPDLLLAETDPAILKEAAFRIMLFILVHGWQRSCSLISVEVRHLIASMNFTDVDIPSSKGGLVDQRIPAWVLFPAKDLAYLRAFIELLARCQFCKDMRLTELAGFAVYAESSSLQFHEVFCRRLSSISDSFRKQAPGTHCTRAVGLSWVPVRAFLATYPEMRGHPSLAPYLSHPWFTEDSVNQLKGIIPCESTNVVEVVRRIACWSTSHEFQASYCRSWLLTTELHRSRLHDNEAFVNNV